MKVVALNILIFGNGLFVSFIFPQTIKGAGMTSEAELEAVDECFLSVVVHASYFVQLKNSTCKRVLPLCAMYGESSYSIAADDPNWQWQLQV